MKKIILILSVMFSLHALGSQVDRQPFPGTMVNERELQYVAVVQEWQSRQVHQAVHQQRSEKATGAQLVVALWDVRGQQLPTDDNKE